MGEDTALRYDRAGSLTFRTSAGLRRTVQGGASFLVDAETAEILRKDPLISAADATDFPRGNTAAMISVDGGRPPEVGQVPPQVDVATATKDELLTYAKLLGLDLAQRTKIADVRRSIERELKHRKALKAPLVDETANAVALAAAAGPPAGLAAIAAARARARELGLPTTGKLADLQAAIVAAEATQGGSTPADDPGVGSPGEAGTPPPGDTGPVTLADLPPGAKLGRG